MIGLGIALLMAAFLSAFGSIFGLLNQSNIRGDGGVRAFLAFGLLACVLAGLGIECIA